MHFVLHFPGVKKNSDQAVGGRTDNVLAAHNQKTNEQLCMSVGFSGMLHVRLLSLLVGMSRISDNRRTEAGICHDLTENDHV